MSPEATQILDFLGKCRRYATQAALVEDNPTAESAQKAEIVGRINDECVAARRQMVYELLRVEQLEAELARFNDKVFEASLDALTGGKRRSAEEQKTLHLQSRYGLNISLEEMGLQKGSD